jgi:hypothetical protein
MRELEIAGLASADGLVGPKRGRKGQGPKHAVAHTECLNCGATLHGRYCAECGQAADDHHRSILRLAWEAVEGLTDLDGRLAKTVPALFFRPGALAQDHFEGRRQRHVPPFRLFLVTLLLFMLSLETVTHGKPPPAPGGKPAAGVPAGPGVVVGPPAKAGRTVSLAGGLVTVQADNDKEAKALDSPGAALDEVSKTKQGESPLGQWLIAHIKKANDNRELFRSTIFEWAHRLAILLLPIFALLLTGLYVYKRKFYVYDHLVVSMHFLSFVFLLWAVAYIMPNPVRPWLMLIATIWIPVNLFMTLRGAYGSSIAGAVVKTAFLWVATLTLFLALLVGIIVVALGQM